MPLRHVVKTVSMLALALGLTAFGRCGAPEPKWTLVWSDEFNGDAGTSPQPDKWGFDVGTGPNTDGWGNGQWEYDTARPENASMDGLGHLVITARNESYIGKDYTSARLLTKGLFAQKYGRFEARIQLPVGRGLWPAFWLLGADADTTTWPGCGEIDIMEYRGQDPTQVTGTVHGPGYSGRYGITASQSLPAGTTFDKDFHLFAVEWTPDWVAWELDGVTWNVLVPAALPAGSPWVFDHPFFIILNLAVGGNYVAAPDPSIFPQSMVVDWVRVYERAP
jgi:beta-glucanase (GH16 family)